MYESAKRNYSLKRTRCSVTISEAVVDEFTTYCEEHDYVRQKLIELILEEFLERHGVRPGDTAEQTARGSSDGSPG